LQEGTVPQLPVDTLDAQVEGLHQRDVRPGPGARTIRIGTAKHLHQEVLGLPRALGLGTGQVSLGLELGGVPLHRHPIATDHGDHRRHGRRQPGLPAHQHRSLRHPTAGAGDDGASPEVSLDVGDHGLHGRIAVLGPLAEGFADDGSEIATQPTEERRPRDAALACRILRHEPRDSHGLNPRRGGRPWSRLGPATREKHAQENPELVDVGRSRGSLPRELLRTRIVRGEDTTAGSGALVVAVDEHLGDAEVQEPGLVPTVHEDVRGLEIPVHHQVPMGVMHRAGDAAEELEALVDARLAAVTIVGDGLTADELHRQIR
jgi:hypothetical protein